MTTRIRTLNFLPDIFQTTTNSQFLAASLDQIVDQPALEKIEGYIGSKFGYGINAKDYYVTEPTKVRKDYQLDPGVVFTKPNESVAQDFISYPGVLDALSIEGALTNDNNRLFNSQFYSWDSFTNLDKIINFNQYYWLPEGPAPVIVATDTVFSTMDYIVTDVYNGYNIVPTTSSGTGTTNPTITLLRGGTYSFAVNQDSEFWIQGAPGVTGYSPIQPNLSTRDVLGVENNGASVGIVTFTVPSKNAQDNYNFPGNNLVDLVSTIPFNTLNGVRLSTLANGIDGVTSLDGLTVMFYNTGIPYENGYISTFYDGSNFDENTNIVSPITISVTGTTSGTNAITCNSTENISVGNTITFTGVGFGGLNVYQTGVTSSVNAGSFTVGQEYSITNIGTTDWASIGLQASAEVTASITDTIMSVTSVTSGELQIGQTITGSGIAAGTKILSYDRDQSLLTGNPTYIVSISQTVASTTISGYDIVIGKLFTATGAGSGTGIATPNLTYIYYVRQIISSTEFTVSDVLTGDEVQLVTATGSLTGSVNQGLFEEGYYTNVSNNFYTINYVGPVDDPILSLTPASLIPSGQKITANFGTSYNARNFFKNSAGVIEIIPFLSAPLDTLYYQDGTSESKVGIIKIVESNILNGLNVEKDILGKPTYTSTTGVKFTNGLKVTFQGTVVPEKYKSNQYYVEGVGTAIQLLPVTDMIVPESFTSSTYIPWDTTPWDIGNWEGNSYIPVKPDYITIARNSLDKNAWSRSNRWFHIDVINATATYNNTPEYTSYAATNANKAKRPIIEFYPNLRLFNSGTEGKSPVDFVDQRTTDAFTLVAGQQNYYPDVAVYTDYTATITGTNYAATRTVTATSSVNNALTCNSTSGFRVNDIVTFSGAPMFGGLSPADTYYVKDIISLTEFTVATEFDGQTVILTTGSGTMTCDWVPQSTEVTIAAADVTGSLKVGQYITDSTNILPRNSIISNITGTSTLTLTVIWNGSLNSVFDTTTGASLVISDTTVDNYRLFDGSTVVFAADTSLEVRNKIFLVQFSTLTGSSAPVITLSNIDNGTVLENQQTVALRGYHNQGKDFYYNGDTWISAQQKITVNQAPLFDIFDSNGISLGDREVYVGTSFAGSTLFSYGIGSGIDDTILGFPIKYSSVDNVGDISFDVTLNSDTFNYVQASTPITQKINTGYVYQYVSRTEYERQIGWQTAVSPSIQYQVFEFDYEVSKPTNTFKCDIAPAASTSTAWPIIQVYINNIIQPNSNYSISSTDTTTTVTLNIDLIENTVVQILIYSDQVSSTAYYQIPINLNNNPLNVDVTTVNVGDIRGQYQSIFTNNPNITGDVFGPNNIRDLGNVVPWGNKIIQNSASLVLPGAFLRKQDHNVFNALMFNSKEYIKFKSLLVDTVNNTNYEQRFDASTILDDALDQITANKTDSQPFFWSDMLPSKAAYISNTYSFANSLDTSIYPLSRIYDFTKANYYSVLVYLTRAGTGLKTVQQLVRGTDYTISDTSPSLTVTLLLQPGDQITIKEYNQTYGSYVPNTPTKLGLYPAFIPGVVLDSNYTTPTYFIKGHDGSYNKLYGAYYPVTGILEDFRDQVLLEYELRVYNNLKLSAEMPINVNDILPGFFRNTQYSFVEWLEMYSTSFLNWVGQNRLDYKRHVYNKTDQYTFNYWQTGNKINKEPIEIGYWRGIYQYFYDTTTPDSTPWEMLGFVEQPDWWETKYGLPPYTSDNLILWTDLANGINWNNGDPIVVKTAIRPQLLSVLPVDSAGNLVSPMVSVVGQYNPNLFQREWKVGDCAPVEFSYRRSSSYPFDLMRLFALAKPADFFNLAVDIDNYKFNTEFNQFLVNDRSHLVVSDIQIYGTGTAKTSYINWIVDYEKQLGLGATENITTLLDNLDVRLVYRLAGFSDKTLLKFYVEKGTPNSRNASLLIPDESYSVLLYDNQPFTKLVYSGLVVQLVNGGYSIYGNAQSYAYFKLANPKTNGNTDTITVQNLSVKIFNDYVENSSKVVPYGVTYYSVQEVAQFIASYGAYLQNQGAVFDQLENGLEVNWKQMIAEFLYWSQTGWQEGSVITLNPAAKVLKINKENSIVHPLTIRNTNFVLNQNLYPIQNSDLNIIRNGVEFTAQTLNDGDTIAYGQFNLGNFEHGIVFDNVTLFNDVIYNLSTGLRQTRIILRGTKSADWNGTVDAGGFIYNQDNIKEWSSLLTYTKGEIVKYKNRYWTAVAIVQPNASFVEKNWVRTDYDQIQKGLLPNSSTRSYESTLYYDVNKANLENDADVLSFSLIGYRPRDYLALVDLTDITQVNVYKNLLKSKGTLNATNAFKGANLPQGGIDYDVYENWAIKSGEFGGVLNNNFVDVKLQQHYLSGNPAIIGLTNGIPNQGVQQEIPLYSIYNYGRPITNPDVLPLIDPSKVMSNLPDAGYVNFNDVKLFSYFYNQLPAATNASNTLIPLSNLYVRDYLWLANYLEKWQVFTPSSLGIISRVSNNLNNTLTLVFEKPHNLSRYEPFAVVNLSPEIDNYYISSNIPDPYSVIVPYTLATPFTTTGVNGIGLRLTSQRISQPSDIASMDLLTSEFTKNTVWVDVDSSGSWGVYRKSISYQYQNQKLGVAESNLGYAVATTSDLGYLASEPYSGEVHRYIFVEDTNQYKVLQTITKDISFGSCIAHAGNIFVISEPTSVSPKVYIYELDITTLTNELIEYQTAISAPANSINWGSALALSGDTNWLYISDYNNEVTPNIVHVYKKSQLSDEYEFSTTITVSGLSADDKLGYSLSTNYYGDTLIVGAPNVNNESLENYGKSYVFARIVQNIEVQYNSASSAQTFALIDAPSVVSISVTSTTGSTDVITCSSTSAMSVDDPVIFSGTPYLGSEILLDTVYYVHTVVNGTTFKIKASRDSVSALDLGNSSGSGLKVNIQSTAINVSVNGSLVSDNNYGIVDGNLVFTTPLIAGDIITASLPIFSLMQTLTAETTPRIGVQFGYSVSTNISGSEVLIGAPFELNAINQEGAVHRFTNAGSKYGIVIGESSVNVTAIRSILINGFLVQLPIGNANTIAAAINAAKVTNVSASDLSGKLVLSLINQSLGLVNQKLNIVVTDNVVLDELGLKIYNNTQTITCPHKLGRTQFGSVVKFNEHDSIIVGAPVGTRYVATTFDFVDDENQDDDTLFDNNATAWIDTFPNSGTAYIFDYVANYDENLLNVGKFVYAQSVNALNIDYGSQPLFGSAIDFYENNVIVGSRNFSTDAGGGQFVTFTNKSGVKNWALYRKSSEIVDINRIANTLLYSEQTNNTLINLDYFDPLQGKLLGAVRENIDVISSNDPAIYNLGNIPNGSIWGAKHVGQIWFNTKNVKFVNYHQEGDNVYNSKYWGTVFPNSDVAVYSWVSSPVRPNLYTGPGTPYDINAYSTQYVLNASGIPTEVYFFWVRDTNIVFVNEGKTLADSVIASYITNPQNSGISYFSPLLSNVFGLYNAGDYINASDSILHIGYLTGTNDDVSHSQFNMIRANFDSDFLPGVPTNINGVPESLYDRLLDSLCGVDEFGEVVPNPYLPKQVQYGIQARPRQSFFVNRFKALENYLKYANEILALYPISEIRQASLLDTSGEFYDTADYWEYVNWWIAGYSDNTKAALQVSIYADLATLNVSVGTIVSVSQNGYGKAETYVLESTGSWKRIGLQNGTIKFKSSLWSYSAARLGFGDNFFDTTPYDMYPSEETRKIVRALNEQIYTQDLLIYRNKSLILLFEYIQSETTESQNYLPWLNKTSFIDVGHTIRELKPIEVFQTDNQDFLSGYINEVKPYHVVIKEFLFKYTGSDVYQGTLTDFDLPAKYNKTTETFITPELVYSNASSPAQFLPSSPIWQESEYNEWFTNKGISLTGELDVQVTKLESYISLNSSWFSVDNAQGLPINGILFIGGEQIGYSIVDRALNVVSGLTRGVNGTTITTHNPGELIYMDLPAVLLLDGGRAYTEPPKVTAYIDPILYPAPTRPAVLSAVMNLDSVLRIDVIDPGQGYAVLPKIIIDPSTVITFASSAVSTATDTIQLYAPVLQTGDLVQYNRGVNGTAIGGLVTGEWYYVNVLETTPTVTIALYSSYSDCVSDSNRIKLFNQGSGTQHSLSLGGKASAISTAAPVRENNVTLRFDRTTYNSNIIQWESGKYYGAYYAGTYSNSESVSSSSIQLQSTQPPIDSILASTQGVSFEITNVKNVRDLNFSSLARNVYGTFSGTNIVRLIPLDDGSNNPNASGTTIGFYVGMPIKFSGAVVGNLQNEVVYYVHSIVNETDFTVSTIEGGDPLGLPMTLTTGVVGIAGLKCYTGIVKDTAVLTVIYPGISTVTNTFANTNTLTIPLNPTGTGGTSGFYIGLPIFFTGTMIGGVVENQVYYITTIIDKETFTMSENATPTTVNVIETSSSGNVITVDDDAQQFSINEPIIINNMFVGGVAVSSFGNIQSGQTYYIVGIIGGNQLQISGTINGSVLTLSNETGEALLTSQSNVINLTTDSGTDMTINISLPVSPGQINGQQFTLYQTSSQFPNLTGTIGNLLSETIGATLSGSDIVGLLNKPAYLYENMPVTVSADIGSLVASTTYYIKELGDVSITISSTSSAGDLITCASTSKLYIDMPIVFTGSSIGEILPNVEYYVHSIINSTQFTITNTPNGTVTTQTTDNGLMIGTGSTYVKLSTTLGGSIIDPGDSQQVATISIGANAIITVATSPANGTPVQFRTSGSLPSGMSSGTTYYVRNRTGTTFNISLTPAGSLITTSGTQSGIQTVILKGDYTLDQVTSATPSFDISFILGGVRAIIEDSGSGFAETNTITILGTSVGGTSPTNDITLTVNEIGTNGEITSVSCSGTTPVQSKQYYLKVISANELEVYENPLLTIPVSGINFPFVGDTTTIVSGTQVTTNLITVQDTSGFSLYDPVVFTGDVSGGIELGVTYYILSIPSSITLKVSTMPGDVTTELVLTNSSATFLMAKQGSMALLPEPFYFNQSIVKYNNRVYLCIISNNDTEFIFGKWELLTSGDRRLNALDRILGYYQPTSNMPGIDVTQLVKGVEYPNSTYLGNAFAPEDQYPLDTILTDQVFYPTQITTTSVIWNGLHYVGAINSPTYSGIIVNSGDTWDINQLSNVNLIAKKIVLVNGKYLIGTDNTATPILKSTDLVTWTASGTLTTTDGVYHQSLTNLLVNSLAFNNGYVAVGDSILSSTDADHWTQRVLLNTDPKLYNILNDVVYVSVPGFSGFVAVGKGQHFDYSTGLTTVESNNLVCFSTDVNNWTTVNTYVTLKGFNGVASNNSILVAVGENGIIYYSSNGSEWLGINETTVTGVNASTNILNVGSTVGFSVNDEIVFSSTFNNIVKDTVYYVVNIPTLTQIQVSATLGGSPITLNVNSPAVTTYVNKYPVEPTLNSIHYANSMFMAVGNDGMIISSSDGFTWSEKTSGVTADLYSIAFNSTDSVWIASGENNIIIRSTDNGNTWSSYSIFVASPTVYNVQGANFEFGYGPEELVSGVVSDTLTMLVNTRPGTNWEVTEYAHVGYNVVSVELFPQSGTQTVYSFADIVTTPAQIAVWQINSSSGLGTRLYPPSIDPTVVYTPDYTVDWIEKTITISAPLPYLPSDSLFINVYEVGNGDQLVKANTDTDPILTNSTTGFNEIDVNCNYSSTIFSGGGVIRPGSNPKDVIVIETESITDTILCEDVTGFILNDPITFQGATFGGILEDTTYYVKSISYVTNRITISASYNIGAGTAGPTLALSDATGIMYAIIQIGTGAVWTDPIIYHNGTKLVLGTTGTITRTSAINNGITCNTTAGLIIGTDITFSNTIFGGVIQPMTKYKIFAIHDANEFVLEDPANPGNPLVLTTATGGAIFISNDYAFGIASNGISAKIMFATDSYEQSTDYLVYSLFGETTPEQYGYTIPETQMFVGDGSITVFNLTNYVGGSNSTNAVVEIDGLRLANSAYTINSLLNTITFGSAPANNAVIAVTTYNMTERQYFSTSFDVTGKTTAKIVAINNSITAPLTTNVTNTTVTTNYITCASTSGFVSGQPILFKGGSFGGISTSGTYYFVGTIVDSTTFTIVDELGATITLSTASGLIVAYVGGNPAVRITTSSDHGFVDNDIIRIDGTSGSVQLNNQLFYAKKVSSIQFDLYQYGIPGNSGYNPAYAAVNYPVVEVSSYTGGGFTWKFGTFNIVTTTATETSTDPILGNRITVLSTSGLSMGTPVYFGEAGVANGATIMGGLVAGTEYYIKEIFGVTEFSVSAVPNGSEVVLTNDTGTMYVTEWSQENVDRIWVTINGERVPSSSLRLNYPYLISILHEIHTTDKVTITSMMPSATPNEECYMLNIDKSSVPTVYRANTRTRTWLTKPLYYTDETIFVNDVTRVIDTVVTEATTPPAVSGIHTVGINGDKRIISSITVYNNTKSAIISSSNYSFDVVDLSPVLKIESGAWISSGDSLTITVLVGNLIYINGEKIKFTSVDLTTNTITGFQRGANGTGEQRFIPNLTEVFSVLTTNLLPESEYNQTWNSNVFDTTDGDPLQISNTSAANFLLGDRN